MLFQFVVEVGDQTGGIVSRGSARYAVDGRLKVVQGGIECILCFFETGCARVPTIYTGSKLIVEVDDAGCFNGVIEVLLGCTGRLEGSFQGSFLQDFESGLESGTGYVEIVQNGLVLLEGESRGRGWACHLVFLLSLGFEKLYATTDSFQLVHLLVDQVPDSRVPSGYDGIFLRQLARRGDSLVGMPEVCLGVEGALRRYEVPDEFLEGQRVVLV